MSASIEHRVTVQLRWRDMDMLGHLNQSVYHEFLEEGRVALMSEIARRTQGESGYGTFVLAHVELDHRAEVRRGHESVDVLVRLEGAGASSLRLEHEIRLPDGTVAAEGRTVLVAWDPERRAKRELSEAERRALAVPSRS